MKQKLIVSAVAAAFAGAAGIASAGTISVASIGTYAAETIGGATGPITLGNVAFTIANPFAASSTQTITYTLSSKVNTCPTGSLSGPSVGGATITSTNPPTPTGTGSNVCSYTVTVTSPPMAGGTIFAADDAKADKAAGAVLAGGGNVTATLRVLNSGGNEITSETATATVAESAQALSVVWTTSGAKTSASGLFPTAESAKVDVTSTPVATAFTAGLAGAAPNATVNLGAFTLRTNSGKFLDSDGTALVNVSALTTNEWDLTVSGPFAANTKSSANDVVFLSENADCSTVLTDSRFTLSGTSATLNNFDASIVTITLAEAQNVYVCYTPQAGLTTKVQIPTGSFSGTAATTAETAVTANMEGETGTGALYTLGSNGASVDVRVITTTGTAGWSTVLRIINTGAVATPIRATYLNADGTSGGATGVIVTSLAPGAVAMVSSAQIEQALNVSLASTANPPRINISGSTDSLTVQAWVNANGQWFMGTPGQSDDANKAGVSTGVNPK